MAAAEVTAAAVESAEPYRTFSQFDSTRSPARSSRQASAGKATVACVPVRISPAPLRFAASNSRVVEVTAMPTASNVMTVSAPLATDRSARTKVIRTMIPKNAAAASVSHIGDAGELHSWLSETGQVMVGQSGSCAMASQTSRRIENQDGSRTERKTGNRQ